MPEGPEIRRAADKVAAVLVGKEAESVTFGLPQLRRFENHFRGHTVTAVDTRGKAMLTRFDNGLTLYSHNQLYGRWYVRARGELPRTRRSLRVAFHTALHSALLYSATDIEVLDHDDENIRLATHTYGKGRAVYCEQFQYSMQTVRLLNRMLHWAAGEEEAIKNWQSSNPMVECTAFEEVGKFVVTNVSYEEASATITKPDGTSVDVTVEANGLCWMEV